MTVVTPRFDPAAQAGLPHLEGEQPYVYRDERIAVAVNVALATGRPLLISGVPGSGKSTLAADIARRLGWAYLDTVITSRTRLEDLVAEVDLVRRLSHAEQGTLGADSDYVVPGILWWATDPATASVAPAAAGRDRRRRSQLAGNGIVVLLDEIDKAEPDLPNDLLGPLGDGTIEIPHIGSRRPSGRVLVIVTTNGERDMPPAFLRRCLHLELRPPGVDDLVEMATAHYGPDPDALYRAVARELVRMRRQARLAGRRLPSTAEYLDTVKACREHGERPGSPLWQTITEIALVKSTSDGAGSEAEDEVPDDEPASGAVAGDDG